MEIMQIMNIKLLLTNSSLILNRTIRKAFIVLIVWSSDSV